MNILLLGHTGSGKSTFVENWFSINGLSSHDIFAKTEYPFLFHYENDLDYCLIDTPGILDPNKRSQKMMNNLAKQLRCTDKINAVILFHKYTGRLDENFQQILIDYDNLLNLQDKIMIICFTGLIEREQKQAIVSDINTLILLDDYKVDSFCFWRISREFNINNFNEIKKFIIDKANKFKPHKSRLIEKIILKETFIANLNKDLKDYERKDEKNTEIIELIKQEIRNAETKTFIKRPKTCPGITINGDRCSRSIYCHWYHNYKNGLSNAHRHIMEEYEIKKMINGDIDYLNLIEEVNKLQINDKEKEVIKREIRTDEYENLIKINYSSNIELPDFENYDGTGIFEIVIKD